MYKEVLHMFIKLLIISLIIVSLVMLTLGIKLWFDPKAEFTVHSCASDHDSMSEPNCPACGVDDPAHCLNKDIKSEKKRTIVKYT